MVRAILSLQTGKPEKAVKSTISPYEIAARALAERLPYCISVDAPWPLATGFTETVQALFPDMNPDLIRRTMGWYCRRLEYHKSFKEFDYRVDIGGGVYPLSDAQKAYHAGVVADWPRRVQARAEKSRRRDRVKKINRRARLKAV